ncbi:MAG: phosphatase [Betaproteobacteria bacterium]|jgi:protein-tyrosine phosphatase|nr:MAG: phosphatase [Betaproteobacteria bacterium]TMH28627.1 MAG: phosphatase [Betaproteobacteria bacterium]
MPLRRVSLPDSASGSLWLTSMPGRFERWSEFVADAKRARVSLVVCLTSPEEAAELSPDYWRAISEGSAPFRWLNLPMQNFGLPNDMPAFDAGIEQAATRLLAGDAVVLHCAAGLGRTGTAAACLLKRLGLSTSEAMRRVREAGSNPENALQSGLVNRF